MIESFFLGDLQYPFKENYIRIAAVCSFKQHQCNVCLKHQTTSVHYFISTRMHMIIKPQGQEAHISLE